jgi:hypothetical protein
MRFFLVLAVAVASGTLASAQSTLLEFNFNTASGVTAPATFNSTFNAPAVSPSVVGRGSGIVADAVAGSFSSTAWTNAITPDANDYYSFTYSNSLLSSLSGLSLIANRNGLGPRLLEVRDSITGFGVAGVSQPLPNASQVTPIAFNLSTIPALQNIPASTTVELRIYAYDSNNATTSQFALDSSGNASGLTLTGTPVPEPTTVGGLAAASLFGIGWVRRRFRKAA